LDAAVFAITGEVAGPNPYDPSDGTPLYINAVFSQGHSNMKIRIYSAGLRCVREYEFPDAPWAGTRSLSIPAASLTGLANGSYYYVITAENSKGQKVKSGIPCLVILR
jgi:hypothetical protein